jgi:hypothetical protein
MTVAFSDAERIVDDILSNNSEILIINNGYERKYPCLYSKEGFKETYRIQSKW